MSAVVLFPVKRPKAAIGQTPEMIKQRLVSLLDRLDVVQLQIVEIMVLAIRRGGL